MTRWLLSGRQHHLGMRSHGIEATLITDRMEHQHTGECPGVRHTKTRFLGHLQGSLSIRCHVDEEPMVRSAIPAIIDNLHVFPGG